MSNTPIGPMYKARASASQPSETSFKRKRGVFQKDLQHMMYGFGDDSNPLPETVALVEDIVVEYVTDMVHKAQDIASKRGKLLTEDFLFLIRKVFLSPFYTYFAYLQLKPNLTPLTRHTHYTRNPSNFLFCKIVFG
ncbi:transcription initiation factor TFIID subunit 13 [Artemisia annua]|uniref:Transcription initiation factor TFIID subunit 13 n=1 Tax=Artemisia annua TaxID=35608 RepID=A0A2U1M3L6_ARTAN|nr:transcription initiation factor TFIID subunit 13 [Artemisia annua]